MVGHQWLPWINNPTSGSISVTSAKQEQDISSDCLGSTNRATCRLVCPVVGLSALCLLLLVTCASLSVLYNNESDRKPEWKNLLFDFQNVSSSYLSLTKANSDLRRDHEKMMEQSVQLYEQNKLLNRTSDKLVSYNAALSLESSKLMEQIVNLTSANLQLTQEHMQLVELTSEQEEEKLNMSETIKDLMASNARREEENRRLSDVNGLLKDELVQVKEENRELLEINDQFQDEMKNLSEKIGALLKCEEASKHNTQLQERVTELQEQIQNLSSMLRKERQEAAERQKSRETELRQRERDMHSLKEAFQTLDLYCPVVNLNTKERVCRKCQDSWRLFDNKCYYLSSRRLTWTSSRTWCQTQGGDLLIINSEPEQKFIFETSQTVEQSGSRLWIGMTDAEEEGDWTWVDGSPVSSGVQFWLNRPGTETEPDDWKLDNPLGEDCGHIDTSENAWMDGSCETPYRWICEKNV